MPEWPKQLLHLQKLIKTAVTEECQESTAGTENVEKLPKIKDCNFCSGRVRPHN